MDFGGGSWAARERVAQRFKFTLPIGVLIGVAEFVQDRLELAESSQAAGHERSYFDAPIFHRLLQSAFA